MAIGITVRADTEKLDGYPEEVTAVLQQVVTEVARTIKAEARQRAPVRTGALRDSIHNRPVGKLSEEVVAEVDYAVYVELGTTRTPPRPFLGPAAQSVVGRVEGLVRQALEKID